MASAVILTNFYGTDAISFSVGSDAAPGVLRSYSSPTACAAEIGMSRIYGGIHFMSANRDGKACGACVAQFVFHNFLLANNDLPRLSVEGDNGSIKLRLNCHAGKTCILESSPDLRVWSTVATRQTVVGGSVTSLQTIQRTAARFYRIQEQ
jgi:hypothetical protein